MLGGEFYEIPAPLWVEASPEPVTVAAAGSTQRAPSIGSNIADENHCLT